MTKFYVVRHGNSQANLDNIFAGAGTDAPLTEVGKKQAQLVAAYMKENVQVDKVYASPLCRAFETGRAIANALQVPIEVCEDVREIEAGQWEGIPFDDIGKWEESHLWNTNIGRCACPEGESVAHLQQRVVGAIKALAQKHEGESLVVVCHATPVRALQCHCMGESLDDMQDIPWVSNASTSTVVYDEGKLTMEQAGFDDYLKDLKTVLPDNI